jgi:hypothetical protein
MLYSICISPLSKELAMSLDLEQERQQAHALIDLLPPAKLGAVRNLLGRQQNKGVVSGDEKTVAEFEG